MFGRLKKVDDIFLLPWEFNRSNQANDRLIFVIKHIGRDSIFSRWDLSRYSHIFCNSRFSFFNGARHIDILNLFAEIGLCVDETDKTVFDL